VFKGKKMAGHMGDQQITILNLRIHSVDKEKGVILVHGAVPGCNKGIVYIRDAVKKAERRCSNENSNTR
jgi:large subunit ribosomal protein L3